jgi:hypothetical protein
MGLLILLPDDRELVEDVGHCAAGLWEMVLEGSQFRFGLPAHTPTLDSLFATRDLLQSADISGKSSIEFTHYSAHHFLVFGNGYPTPAKCLG